MPSRKARWTSPCAAPADVPGRLCPEQGHCGQPPEAGFERGLHAHALLRPLWRGEEDAGDGAAAGDVRPGGGKGLSAPRPGIGRRQLGDPSAPSFRGTHQVRVEHKPWTIEVPGRSSKLEVEMTTVTSNYHVEMNPSDVGNNDRCGAFAPSRAARRTLPLLAEPSRCSGTWSRRSSRRWPRASHWTWRSTCRAAVRPPQQGSSSRGGRSRSSS